MAIGAEARRQEGVSALGAEFTRGSVGKNDTGSAVGTEANLPNVGGGSGELNRGSEANTNLMGSDSAPEIDTSPAGELDTVVRTVLRSRCFGQERVWRWRLSMGRCRRVFQKLTGTRHPCRRLLGTRRELPGERKGRRWPVLGRHGQRIPRPMAAKLPNRCRVPRRTRRVRTLLVPLSARRVLPPRRSRPRVTARTTERSPVGTVLLVGHSRLSRRFQPRRVSKWPKITSRPRPWLSSRHSCPTHDRSRLSCGVTSPIVSVA